MARKIRLAAAGIELTPKQKPLVSKADLGRRERQLAFLLKQRDYKPPKGTSLIAEARRRCQREIRDMKKQLSRRKGQAKQAFGRAATNAVPRRLGTAGGFSRTPPGGGGGDGRTKSSDRHPPSGLTAKFNAAAAKPKPRRPVSVLDIERLEKLRSKPGMIPAPSPLGRIGACYDAHRDRNIGREINAIKSVLAERKNFARDAFRSASKKGTLTHSFNKSASRKR